MTALIVDDPKAIAIVGGAQVTPVLVNTLQTLTETFVAADSGADHLLAANITPRAVIGDFDSISQAARRAFAPYLTHVTEQESTDLEKVLQRVAAPVIVGAGFLGGRMDHSFAAFNVMARYEDVPLILVSRTECCFRAPNGPWRISLPVGTDFAVLPMARVVVTSHGLKWDMDQLVLRPVGQISSSNKVAASEVQLDVTGPAIVTLPLDHLDAAITVVRAG